MVLRRTWQRYEILKPCAPQNLFSTDFEIFFFFFLLLLTTSRHQPSEIVWLSPEFVKDTLPDKVRSKTEAEEELLFGSWTAFHDRPLVSLASEPNRVVRDLTNFKSGRQLVEEFVAVGGPQLFTSLDRSQRKYDQEAMEEGARLLIESKKWPEDVVKEALAAVAAAGHFAMNPVRSHHGRYPVNLFALPFALLGGGLRLTTIGTLPYWNLSESQVSLVLSNILKLIVRPFRARWCPPLTAEFLKMHAVTQGAAGEHVRVYLTVMADGSDIEVQSSKNRRTQRMMYGTKKKTLKHNAVRVIVWTTERGCVLRVSKPAAASISEIDILEHDRFLDDLNHVAFNAGEVWDVDVVVDRGYFFLSLDKTAGQQKRYGNLNLHKVMPHHKDVPTRRKKSEPKREKRSRFLGQEALFNKQVASRRAKNEVANAFIKCNRLLHGVLDLSLLHIIDDLMILAWGMANMRLGFGPFK